MQFLVQQKPAYVYTGSRAFDASLPSIVFIHGAANDHSVWTLQARYFAHHGWNALALDLPGHGRSFGEPKESVTAYADWVINLLDNGNIEKAVLVGHSMGALVALDGAFRHVDRVSALGLVGCSVPMPVSDALLDAARNDPETAFNMLNIWGHAPRLKWGRNPTPGTSSMMAYKRLLQLSRPGVLATDLSACAAYQPASDALSGLDIPIRLITGTEDMMTPPKAARALHAGLPNASLSLIDGSGHAVMQEAPGALLDELRSLTARPGVFATSAAP